MAVPAADRLRWVQRGLAPVALDGARAGMVDTLADLRAEWSRAEKEGVVNRPFEDVEAVLVALFMRSPAVAQLDAAGRPRPGSLSEEQLLALEEAMVADGFPQLTAMAERMDADFLTALFALYATAAIAGTAADAFREQVVKMAKRWGYGGLAGADLAKTWLNSALRWPAAHAVGLSAAVVPEVSGVFPYLRYRTKEDDRVRQSHAALSGFVAASTWPGWPGIMPPLDWNCRCWLERISWHAAREMGLAGELPLGASELIHHHDEGGIREGFPHAEFVPLAAGS